MQRYVIVGGVAGGMSAAARLRRLDESADIVVFERGDYVSFANCGLPYYVGDVIAERAELLVQTPQTLKDRLNLDVRTRTEVVAINRAAKTVTARSADGQQTEVPYDYLILAPGAEPLRPPLPGIDDPRIFTVRSIPDADKIKATLAANKVANAVIVGGGFIGIEMADNLTKAGVKVQLVEMMPQVLGTMLDPDMAALVHEHLRRQGVALHFGHAVKAFSRHGEQLVVHLADGRQLETDMVVLAIGVRPEVTLARDCGLELGPRGGIKVDQYMRTSDPHIYAVGDAVEVCELVTGAPALIPLAGPANKQGRLVANNICGRPTPYRGTQGTAIVDVAGLTAAGTGATQALLDRNGIEYRVSITHSFPHATYYPGGSVMTIKLLFAPDGKLLGAQIVGKEGVDKRIDVLATALRFGGTVADLQELELAYAPPFSSAKDPVNIAGYAAGNVLCGDVKTVQAHEVGSLQGKAFFLDVREEAEHLAGAIPDSVNIPLGQLRQRLAELPSDKQIVVYCAVGHRAYVACRLLSQRGYNVANLVGGWRTYRALTADKAVATSSPTDGGQAKDHARAEIAAASLEAQPVAPDSPPACQTLDCTGLACPGPIARVHATLSNMAPGSSLLVKATDPGFATDIEAWCNTTGNTLVGIEREGDAIMVKLRKGQQAKAETPTAAAVPHDKTIVVFSNDLDKVLAAFVIATGAAAMDRKVTMFFTFWGLNVLRRTQQTPVRKGFLDRMFGLMMPRGSRKLGLSRLHMLGVGPRLIRHVMKGKGIASLEELMDQAIKAGVRIVACQMSMDVMGIKKEELMPGVEVGGVASYLAAAETADTNLFI